MFNYRYVSTVRNIDRQKCSRAETRSLLTSCSSYREHKKQPKLKAFIPHIVFASIRFIYIIILYVRKYEISTDTIYTTII